MLRVASRWSSASADSPHKDGVLGRLGADDADSASGEGEDEEEPEPPRVAELLGRCGRVVSPFVAHPGELVRPRRKAAVGAAGLRRIASSGSVKSAASGVRVPAALALRRGTAAGSGANAGRLARGGAVSPGTSLAGTSATSAESGARLYQLRQRLKQLERQ